MSTNAFWQGKGTWRE